MVGFLDGVVTHLPFDHSGIATIPSFHIDFVGHFVEE